MIKEEGTPFYAEASNDDMKNNKTMREMFMIVIQRRNIKGKCIKENNFIIKTTITKITLKKQLKIKICILSGANYYGL